MTSSIRLSDDVAQEAVNQYLGVTKLTAQSASLSLYSMTDELAQLMAVYVEMIDAEEDTAEIEAAILEYRRALPQKVDGTAHVIRTMENVIRDGKDEVKRISKRVDCFKSALDRLKSYCCDALALLPMPKKGSRRLEGRTATLLLKGNGGVQRLEITDPAMVPDDYKKATIVIPAVQYRSIREHLLDIEVEILEEKVEVDNDSVRAELAKQCEECRGSGVHDRDEHGEVKCPVCRGEGRQGVPGAHLLPRGEHLEVR